MININNKLWDDLSFDDVQDFLSSSEIENFFFEFKLDDVSSGKLVKEICAFANTYGGYIFLGINNDKDIVGCQEWDEQRIHATIHDSITPVPIFQIKCLGQDVKIYVIRIEEGLNPPYITNKGQIFERVSSGSFPIKESSKLTQLFYKSENALQQIKNKIELPEIDTSGVFPSNVCAYMDMGFSLSLSGETELEKNFYNIDLSNVTNYLRGIVPQFNISRVGLSYVFSLGPVSVKNSNGKEQLAKAGMNNFMEILPDGSIKSRIILSADDGANVNIAPLAMTHSIYKTIYSLVLGDDIYEIFISAKKYEKLTVLNQFLPYLKLNTEDTEENKMLADQFVDRHKDKYGGDLIIYGNRIPVNNFYDIDRQNFDQENYIYNNENLMDVLFASDYFLLGFIDMSGFKKESDEL